MKRFVTFILTLLLPFCLVACNNAVSQKDEPYDTEVPEEERGDNIENTESAKEETGESMESDKTNASSNILVVYFSATGTTKPLAEYAADILNADIYEIVPADPYTEEDLEYYTDCRADKEQNDPTSRPEILGSISNIEDYDTIILGYPIWHGQAPRIISTFLESYDFSGKTILPFCTSHSSGIGSSDTNLHSLASNANWLSGKRFAGGTTREEIEGWLNEMGIES